MQELKEQIKEKFAQGRYDELEQLIKANEKDEINDNDIVTLRYLFPVYKQEKAAEKQTLFEKAGSMERLLERYTRLRFYLRRIDFDLMDGGMETFYAFVSENGISIFELVAAVRYSVVHKDKVLRLIGGNL